MSANAFWLNVFGLVFLKALTLCVGIKTNSAAG